MEHLLQRRGKGFMELINKCWGREDVELGNIRLTYQDFRILSNPQYPRVTASTNKLTCHGTRSAINQYALQLTGSMMISNLFKQADGREPTTIAFEGIEGFTTSTAGNIFRHVVQNDGRQMAKADRG